MNHNTLHNGNPAGLYSEQFGTNGRPIIILHGLFGSSTNWSSVARELSAQYQVHTLDLRNHGKSEHCSSHSLSDLRLDLLNWMAENSINQPILLGHSMGGMVAMATALENSDAIGGLIVVDIAPRPYEPHHDKEFAALEMDVSPFRSRSEIDQAMSQIHPSKEVRQFLMMNLERKEDNSGYEWRLNVPVLKKEAFTSIAEFQGNFQRPTLFIRGAESGYIQKQDIDVIKKHFPSAQVESISGAGHWLHHSHQAEFIALVAGYLDSL